MKKVLLCVLFLVIGLVAGSVITGYIARDMHKKWAVMFYAGQLGSAANDALLIKTGESAFLLKTHERTIRSMVAELQENENLRNSIVGDASLKAAKRFYVCTNTPIPEEIDGFLQKVEMFENACE
ncbi:MAG: hypothetical protein KF685_12785 [Acidobacteria bacterium]|nr:hypothetical protein [Acidobacteriota bacterium]